MSELDWKNGDMLESLRDGDTVKFIHFGKGKRFMGIQGKFTRWFNRNTFKLKGRSK